MSKMVKFSNLQIEITETSSEVTYKFVGDVDENFRHEDVPLVKKSVINFELAHINNFNSCGIREWIYLVKKISALGNLVFKECSVTMIDQINMVPDSLGSGYIQSFHAPYYCECGGEVNRLIKVNEAQESLSSRTAPELMCEKCGNPLEFDALEESYFLFANSVLPKVG
jgi:hypothetical protein